MTEQEIEQKIRTAFAKKGGHAKNKQMTPKERKAHSELMFFSKLAKKFGKDYETVKKEWENKAKLKK